MPNQKTRYDVAHVETVLRPVDNFYNHYESEQKPLINGLFPESFENAAAWERTHDNLHTYIDRLSVKKRTHGRKNRQNSLYSQRVFGHRERESRYQKR